MAISITALLSNIAKSLSDIFTSNGKVLAEIKAVRVDLAVLRADQVEFRAETKAGLEQIFEDLVGKPATQVFFRLYDEAGNLIQEGLSPMDAIQNRHTVIHVVPEFLDEDGNVTMLDTSDEPIQVASANPAITIANLSQSTGEFDMVTQGLAGVGPVSLTGDAAKKSGEIKDVAGKIDMTVPPGDAVTVNFKLGSESPNPPTP